MWAARFLLSPFHKPSSGRARKRGHLPRRLCGCFFSLAGSCLAWRWSLHTWSPERTIFSPAAIAAEMQSHPSLFQLPPPHFQPRGSPGLLGSSLEDLTAPQPWTPPALGDPLLPAGGLRVWASIIPERQSPPWSCSLRRYAGME